MEHYPHYRYQQPRGNISRLETPPHLTCPPVSAAPNANLKQSFFVNTAPSTVGGQYQARRISLIHFQRNLTSRNFCSSETHSISCKGSPANMCSFYRSKILIPISWYSRKIQSVTPFYRSRPDTEPCPRSDISYPPQQRLLSCVWPRWATYTYVWMPLFVREKARLGLA